MARPLRLEFAGGLYHVTSRGDRREYIYVDDADRAMFLEVLAQVIGQFNLRLHAYASRDLAHLWPPCQYSGATARIVSLLA
jgi:putative transposase